MEVRGGAWVVVAEGGVGLGLGFEREEVMRRGRVREVGLGRLVEKGKGEERE